MNPIAPVVHVDTAGVATPAGPLLKNWGQVWGSLCGQIYHDPKGRFPDGRHVVTSEVVEMNEAEGWAQTLNTRYLLGERA